MGYYPTSPVVVERVRSFLRFPTENANVLDPCCGEALALRRLTEGANADVPVSYEYLERSKRFCPLRCAQDRRRDDSLERICPGCGNPFKARRKAQTYCSRTCWRRAWNGLIKSKQPATNGVATLRAA